MDERGQGSIYSFFYFVVGLILLVAFLPVINTLVAQAVGGNMSDLLMTDVIKLLLGMSGLLIVIFFIMGAVNDFQQRQQYVG